METNVLKEQEEFRNVVKVLNTISQVGSTVMKVNMLVECKDTPLLKEVLRHIYNPLMRTGISDAKYGEALSVETSAYEYIGTRTIMKYLAKNNTGNAAALERVRAYRRGFEGGQWPIGTSMLVRAICTQKLKIGIDVKTLNKAYGKSFIPVIDCMLGKPWEKVSTKEFPYIVTEKLDGIRRIIIKQDGVSRAFSRSGHEDFGLDEIMEDMEKLPDNIVYDGELLATGRFKDSIALRQMTNSIAATKGTKVGLTFNVFDAVPVEDFFNGESKPAHERKSWIEIHIASRPHKLTHVKAVPILAKANTWNEVMDAANDIWRRGGEGVMLNQYESKYECKRSNGLLKVKNVVEYTLPIIRLEEGSGKFEGTMGAVVVEYNGNEVWVGSGFADYERDWFWNNQESLAGRLIEIDSFGESTNINGGVSLNCPIFKSIVEED